MAVFSPHRPIMRLQPPPHVPWPPPAAHILTGAIAFLQSLLLRVLSLSSWLSRNPISLPLSPPFSTSHQPPRTVASTQKGPQRWSSPSYPSPHSSSCSFIYCSEHHDIPCGNHRGPATPWPFSPFPVQRMRTHLGIRQGESILI